MGLQLIFPFLIICLLQVVFVLNAPTEVQQLPGHTALAYRDGDVMRSKVQTQNFWTSPSYRWPNGRIPYVLSSQYTNAERQIIYNAMAEWEASTCIRFVPKESSDIDYAEITPSDGTDSYCYCWVGRQRGKQIMKMFGECMRHAAMVHELGHLIGFNHEHQRPDRDDFINVYLQNVQPAYHYAFDRFTTGEVDNMGTPYDYYSVMQYPFYAFTTVYDAARPAMTLKDGSIDAIFSEAEHLSPIDISKAQLYYNNCA